MSYLTKGLTFNALRYANTARLPVFKDAKGRIAHAPDGSDWSLADWLQATVGELGELANLLKKVRRGDLTMEEAQLEIGRELADTATYLDILAMRCGVDLGEAITEKFNVVSRRVHADVFFGPDSTIVSADPDRVVPFAKA
jgi:NTP pyrophosphatase (non-canonical NTP hydrolase)